MKAAQKSIPIIVVFILLLSITSISAQEDDEFVPYQEIIMLCAHRDQPDWSYYGDICTWTPGEDTIVRETMDLYALSPHISPDGRYAVYHFLPEFYVEASLQGDDLTGGSGPIPYSIGIMDLTVPPSDPQRFKVIANQEDWTPESDVSLQRRSTPKWSPDSTQLAWIELDLDFEGFGGRLMVYDTTTGKTETIARGVNLGYGDAGMWSIPNIIGWSSVFAHTSVNAGLYPDDYPSGSFGTLLDVYDREGYRSGTAIEYFADIEDRLVSTVWILHQDEWQLGLDYTKTGWVVFDPVEQTFGKLENAPYIQAVAGEGWEGHILSLDTSQPTQIDWEHEDYVAEAVPPGLPRTFDMNGNPIWMNEEGQLLILQQGNIETMDLPDHEGLSLLSAAWTPYIWLVNGESIPVEPAITP